jgi:hypothetical protein
MILNILIAAFIAILLATATWLLLRLYEQESWRGVREQVQRRRREMNWRFGGQSRSGER